MIPSLITLDPATTPSSTKTILTQDGFQCFLNVLPPGAATSLREAHDVEEHILFVIDGAVTIRFGELNTILAKDAALLIPKGTTHLITASASEGAKVLQVEVPARRIVTPQIITIDR